MKSVRRLGIDVGIWNFSFCIVRKDTSEFDGRVTFEVEEWKKINIPGVAGFPNAQGRIEADDICMANLADMVLRIMKKFFPEQKVRHTLDAVRIESQASINGIVTKCGQISYLMYSYFQEIISIDKLCCWLFPDVYMVSAQVKFGGGLFCGVSAASLIKPPGKSYASRKAYSVALVTRLIETKAIFVNVGLLLEHSRSFKKDDRAESLLLAAFEDEDLAEH